MNKLKTVYDFLSNIDIIGVKIIVYMYEDGENADPIYAGSAWDTPYWVADLKLDWIHTSLDCPKPIEFRNSLGEEYNNAPGFVISCTDSEEEK